MSHAPVSKPPAPKALPPYRIDARRRAELMRIAEAVQAEKPKRGEER